MNAQASQVRDKMVRGSYWVLAIRGVLHTLSFVQFIVLARLLAPRDFGLFGAAAVVLGILQAVTSFDFSSALIQKSGNIQKYLNTVWTTMLDAGSSWPWPCWRQSRWPSTSSTHRGLPHFFPRWRWFPFSRDSATSAA